MQVEKINVYFMNVEFILQGASEHKYVILRNLFYFNAFSYWL